MNLTESKSNLARLMSEENLLVEQRSGVRSAFFDTKNRLLVVPKFKDDLSTDCLDLMLSHEVGHSINSPVDWVEICRKKSLNHTIVNVVEDSRIERLVKRKYPGLRSIYYRAYKELSNSDFFGLSKVDDLSSLNLIDKINLYCKIGFLSFIEFNDEEKVLLNKVETTETFEETINVSLEIQNYIKEQLEKQYEEESDGLGENKPSYGDYEPFESITGNIAPLSGETEEGEQDSESSDSGNYNSTLPNSIGGDELGSLEEFIQSNLKSFTQEEAEIRKEELYSESSKDSVYVDIPDIKISEYVEDYKVLYKKLSNYFSTTFYSDWYNRKQIPFVLDQTAYNKFKVENSTVVSYLIKEFNLKKNAQGRKKAKVSKTGDIHLNKLYSYKISEDIFKRSTSIPKSQSHGLVFFLDWSGSMVDWMKDTIKQLLTMLMFCRKQNIPFEVYAFSTNSPNRNKQFKEKEMILQPVMLYNVFSSRMSNSEFVYASNCLLNFDGYSFGHYEGAPGSKVYPPEWFNLGNTPLNHSIFLSKKVVEEFQTRTKVQIVNSIYLTDGESHGICFYVNQNGYARNYTIETEFLNIYFRDKQTKETLLIKPRNRIQETNACVKFTKQISNFRMFAFRLASANELKHNVYSYFGFDADRASKVREFNRDNCIEVPSEFDKFYFVKGNLLNKEESLSEGFDSKTVTTMSKEFHKVMSNRVNTRIFLKKFIDFIS